MIRSSVLLFLLGMAAAADQPTLPAELTLAQALDIALQNATNIRTAVAQLEQATGQYGQARSNLLPQLDIRARQDYQTLNLAGFGLLISNAPSKLGPFASMDARVFLEQQILNFSDIRNWQSFRSRQEACRLLVDHAHELVAPRVVATYLEALKAKTSRDTLSAEAKLADELYRLTPDRVNQGAAAELDANRAMQQVNSLQQQRQEAEQSYVEAKLSLANLLQARITSEFDVSDEAAYGTGTPLTLSRCALSLTGAVIEFSARRCQWELSTSIAQRRQMRAPKQERNPRILCGASVKLPPFCAGSLRAGKLVC